MIRQRTHGPVIGIPTQTLQSLGGVSAEIPPSWVMSQRYILTLTTAGAVPWLIPLVDDDTHPLCDKTDPARDRVELSLAKWAMDERKPVLGVCRGMQLINVAAGGSLYQDLAEEFAGAIKHDYFPFKGQSFARDHLAHEVRVAEGTRLAQLMGASQWAADYLTQWHPEVLTDSDARTRGLFSDFIDAAAAWSASGV